MPVSKSQKYELDPTREDSEDSDFDDGPSRSSAPRKRRPSKGSRGKKPPRKKQRRRNSDSDIDNDEEDISEESWSDDSIKDTVKYDPKTGRPMRRSKPNPGTYEESDSEEEAESTGQDSEEEVATKRGKKIAQTPAGRRGATATKPSLRATQRAATTQSPAKSIVGRRATRQTSQALPEAPSKFDSPAPPDALVVKFEIPSIHLQKFPYEKTTARSRQASARPRSRANSVTSTMAARRTRRQSASAEPEELFELDRRGNPIAASSSSHAGSSRPGTASGEAPAGRGSFSGKSLHKPAGRGKYPSTIMEDSQERLGVQPEPLDEVVEQIDDTRENSPADAEGEAADSDDDMPVAASRRSSRRVIDVGDSDDELHETSEGRTLQPEVPNAPPSNSQKRKRDEKDDDDFDPDQSSDEEAAGAEEHTRKRPRTASSQNTSNGRKTRASRRNSNTDEEMELDEDDMYELQEEAIDLASSKRRRALRPRQSQVPDDFSDSAPRRRTLRNIQHQAGKYQLAGHADDAFLNPENLEMMNVDKNASHSQVAADLYGGPLSRRKAKTGPWGANINTAGVFGGGNDRLAGGVDTDSSDDEAGVALPLTSPKTGLPKKRGAVGFAEDFGKIDGSTSENLGVNAGLGFGSVGGLDLHIKELKDMVLLPLLYPEAFIKYNKKPPRGVLFHGPPGTGKTSLARAVAATMSKSGKKVTFFMRKGADVLSKYVGEAERQLKALFDEAKKCQPAIIFFDEIDGLAPLRKSSSEQIHNTIVACLLSHMDGLDDRGQVVIIGATNRPDQIDEALRRPGRFDKELYFPLPDMAARKVIFDIHTKGWQPAVPEELKLRLAEMSKGYSGADIEALCRETTLAAIQRTFPQIYDSDQKLEIDVNQIEVKPKDFILTMEKIVPSSARAAATTQKPKKERVAPLIKRAIDDIIGIVENIMPQKRKTTALEEAMFDDHDDPLALEFYELEKTFREARVHRPRLLISGLRGMGQEYLATAVLAKFEQLHLQSFDLPTLLEDTSRSPEAAIVQLFREVKRHKPAIIFIPNVNLWWDSVEAKTARVFVQLLQTLDANDEVMVLGIMAQDSEDEQPDPDMMRDLFGFSSKAKYTIQRPSADARSEFFREITAYISRSPDQLPQPQNRKLRHLPVLPVAAVQPEEVQAFSETELKNSQQRDLYLLNQMKVKLRPIMESIKRVYRNLAHTAFDLNNVPYQGEQDLLASDVSIERLRESAANGDENVPAFVNTIDKTGQAGILHVHSGHIFYGLSTQTIDARLENGQYHHPEDFQADFNRLISDFTHIHLVVENPKLTSASDLKATIATDIYALSVEDINWPEYAKIKERFRLREEIKETRRKAKQKENAQKQQEERDRRSPNSGSIQLQSPPRRDRNGSRQASRHGSRAASPTISASPTKMLQLPPQTNGHGLGINATAVPSIAAHTTPNRPTGSGLLTGPSSQSNTTGLTQRSFFEKVVPGTSAADYHNSASTTTSGQKTSSAGHADFSILHDYSIPDGSQSLPDTQPVPSSASGSAQSKARSAKLEATVSFEESNGDSHSDPSQRSPTKSQPPLGPPPLPNSRLGQQQYNSAAPSVASMAPPASTTGPATAVSSLLNPIPSPGEETPAHPPYTLDSTLLSKFLQDLTFRSSGLSVEQLEQVYAALMSAIWVTRAEWNRSEVVRRCVEAFNEVVGDIESIQRILESSLEDEERRAQNASALVMQRRHEEGLVRDGEGGMGRGRGSDGLSQVPRISDGSGYGGMR